MDYFVTRWENQASWQHEAHYLKLDYSKAKLKLGWHSKWNLETPLPATVEWYQVYQ